jgi:hypothetical protein
VERVLPLAEELLVALFDLVQVEEFFDGDGPADDNHDHADTDGDPAVEHHVVGDIAEKHDVFHHVASTGLFTAFDFTKRESAQAASLRALIDRGEFDRCWWQGAC